MEEKTAKALLKSIDGLTKAIKSVEKNGVTLTIDYTQGNMIYYNDWQTTSSEDVEFEGDCEDCQCETEKIN